MKCEDSKYCGCLYYSANALARVITKMAEDAFAVTGLAPSYALLLMGVNEKPGVSPKEISNYMQLTPSTVTRLIEKLENKGLIERKSLGRSTECYPTEKGLELQSSLKMAWKQLFEAYTTILGAEFSVKLTSEIYKASKLLGE